MTQSPLGTGPREEPTAFTAWRALGMLIQLVVTDPGQLDAARDLLTEDLTDVLNRLEPLAAELGCAQELAYVETMMSGEAGYLRQRRIAQENGGDLRAVVRDIVAQNREIR